MEKGPPFQRASFGFLLFLLSFSHLVLAEIKGNRTSGQGVKYESSVVYNSVFIPNQEFCGNLYILNITEGCQLANPPFSSSFNLSFPSLEASLPLIPFFHFPLARPNGCNSYSDVFAKLLPALEILPSQAKPSLILIGTFEVDNVGGAFEAIGEVDFKALPYRFVSMCLSTGTIVQDGRLLPHLCVVTKRGFHARFFLGSGHYPYQVIIGSLLGLSLVLNLYESINSLKNKHFLRLLMFLSCILFSLFRLIEYCWDIRNYNDQMGIPAFSFFTWMGYAFAFLGNGFLLYMWVAVIKGGSFANHLQRWKARMAVGLISVFLFFSLAVCLMGAFATGVPGMADVYAAAYFLLILSSLSMIIFFLVSGIHMILLIRASLMNGANYMALKITLAIVINSLSFLGLIIVLTVYASIATSGVPFTGPQSLGIDVVADIFPMIMMMAIAILFSSLRVFKFLTGFTSSSGTSASTDHNQNDHNRPSSSKKQGASLQARTHEEPMQDAVWGEV